MNLHGKTAVITAGASGIGYEISKRFHELGAKIFICDIDDAALEKASCSLGGIATMRVDVSNPAEVRAFYGRFGEGHDTLDILVNNAGIAGPTKSTDQIADDEWNSTLGVNISAMFYMARGAISWFRRQQSGCVINMSSVAGRVGMPLRLPYSVSKYAVRGLTETLAIELGEIGVRVNSILPGLVDGPRGRDVIARQAQARGISPEDYTNMFLHNISMHSMVQMREIADMAAFLASDLAPHISGQSIGVCGNFESYRPPMVANVE